MKKKQRVAEEPVEVRLVTFKQCSPAAWTVLFSDGSHAFL